MSEKEEEEESYCDSSSSSSEDFESDDDYESPLPRRRNPMRYYQKKKKVRTPRVRRIFHETTRSFASTASSDSELDEISTDEEERSALNTPIIQTPVKQPKKKRRLGDEEKEMVTKDLKKRYEIIEYDEKVKDSYLAVHKRSDRIVRIRFLPIERTEGGLGVDFFRDEKMKKFYSLQHPHFDDFELVVIKKKDPKRIYFVTDYCRFGSVEDVQRLIFTKHHRDYFHEKEIASIVKSVLLALVKLHDSDIVHCRIRTSNFHIQTNGEVKLDLIRSLRQLETNDNIIGLEKETNFIYYSSPEVFQDAFRRPAQDIWALGISILEMAEGKIPHVHEHPMRAIFLIPARPPPELEKKKNWSFQLSDFLSKCFRKDPNLRPSAKDLLEHPWMKMHFKKNEEHLHVEYLKKMMVKYVFDFDPFEEEDRKIRKEFVLECCNDRNCWVLKEDEILVFAFGKKSMWKFEFCIPKIFLS